MLDSVSSSLVWCELNKLICPAPLCGEAGVDRRAHGLCHAVGAVRDRIVVCLCLHLLHVMPQLKQYLSSSDILSA